MTPTTIQLDPQTASALAQQAAAFGLSIQDYLRKHFACGNGAELVKDVDQWLDELSDGLPQLPALPDDFSAKDTYTDHD